MRRRWCRSRNKYRTQSNETNEELYEDIMMRETEMNDQDRLGIAVQLNFPCWISWGVAKNWYCEKEMKKIQVIDREENECHVNLSRVSVSLCLWNQRQDRDQRSHHKPFFFCTSCLCLTWKSMETKGICDTFLVQSLTHMSLLLYSAKLQALVETGVKTNDQHFLWHVLSQAWIKCLLSFHLPFFVSLREFRLE